MSGKDPLVLMKRPPCAAGPAEDGNRARGVDRLIHVLECLHAAREPLRPGELARRLGAPRSTVYEIVNRLLDAGMLETYDAAGRVFFGRSMHFYAVDYLQHHRLSRWARDQVARLAELTDETAQYCTLHGNKYTVLHMQTGRKLFRISSDIGARVPVPWTASGRLLLDHMSREEITRFIPPEDLVLPDGRRIDPDDLYREVRQARRNGYCITTGLVDSVTHCLAVPVRDPTGVAVGCLCLVVMKDRAETDQTLLLDALRDSAGRLSAYLAE